MQQGTESPAPPVVLEYGRRERRPSKAAAFAIDLLLGFAFALSGILTGIGLVILIGNGLDAAGIRLRWTSYAPAWVLVVLLGALIALHTHQERKWGRLIGLLIGVGPLVGLLVFLASVLRDF